jgi:hypothetical protein
MKRFFSLTLALLLIFPLLSASPVSAQQNFKADMVMIGAGLPEAMNGALYTNGTKTRLEINMQGIEMALLLDPAGGSQTIIMPAMRSYMQMPAGMLPVTAPPVRLVNAGNPCAAPEITGCESLGSEQVNGYSASGWRFTADGEQVTAWVSTQLNYPVRMETNGITVNFSNVSLDPVDPALFEIPAGFQPMQGLPFGG